MAVVWSCHEDPRKPIESHGHAMKARGGHSISMEESRGNAVAGSMTLNSSHEGCHGIFKTMPARQAVTVPWKLDGAISRRFHGSATKVFMALPWQSVSIKSPQYSSAMAVGARNPMGVHESLPKSMK